MAKKSTPKTKAKSDDFRGSFTGEPVDKESIEDLLGDLRKDMGDGVMVADGTGLDVKVRGVISTQCAALDKAIGRGGIPLGRLTIIHGPEGSGKTTAALHIVAEVQRVGGIAIYIDKEYKLDLDYGAALGVDRGRLFLNQPDTLEKAFEYMEAVIKRISKLREKLKRRVPVVIVLDSMNAAISKAQFEGEWDDQHYAPQARVFSQSLPKLMPQVYAEDVALVWISQIRQKIGVTFGSDEEISGGKGPRFYASLIISIRRIGAMKKGEEIVGNRTQALIQKNQIAPPFKKAEFMIRYGVGIDNERSILEVAATADIPIIEKAGAWYSYNGTRLGQGLDNSADFLRDHPEILDEIWLDVQDL